MTSSQRMHPIVLQMDPSPEQQLPITARGQNVAVSAGAGTGKTRTLVARFLSLLAEGVPLRSIVAITFTKKAAREMRNRIREEIREYLSTSGDKPSRVRWSGLYEELDAARISTIHSFAAEILRHHPAEMGVDPAFELLDETVTAQLKAQAVEASLAWGAEDPEAAALFPAFGAWSLRRLLAELLDKRLDVEWALQKATSGLWDVWRPHLLGPIKDFILDPAVQEGLDELAALEESGILLQAEKAGDALVEDIRIVIDEWRVIKTLFSGEEWIEISRRVGRLGAHLKQKGKGGNWSPANPKPIIKDLQARFREELDQRGGMDLEIDRQLAQDILPQLDRVFRYAAAWYNSRRNELNGLDFDDLEANVLRLFKEHPETAAYWRNQVRYLLVDEYQDTNQRQRQLVNELSGNSGTLFIVGDGKQSIYRFRGADVSVFREEQERMRRDGLYCELSTSYRAHPALVSALNGMLNSVLGESSELPFVEAFSPLWPGRESPPLVDQQAFVELHLTVGNKSDGAGAAAAEAAAARLLELIESGRSGSQERNLDFGDAAVLCRAASSFADFEAAFEKAGIPYLTIAGQGFFDRPEVRDVLNALRVFLDPDDDLAAAGLMRSPVVGIPDDVVLEIRDFQLRSGLRTLAAAAEEYSHQVPVADGNGIHFFTQLVSEFSSLAERVTAGVLLDEYINKTGYIPALVLAGEKRGVQNLKKLLAEAHQSGIVDLRDYLSAVDDLKAVAVREGEAPTVVEGAVQIMTVHQAKGLEFPVVILGDASKRDPSPRNVLIDQVFGLVPPYSGKVISEGESGELKVTTSSSLAYELAREREKPKEEAESDRLLYVAATRAKDLLLVSGVIGKPTKSGDITSQSGWLGRILGGLEGEDLIFDLDPEGNQVQTRMLTLADQQAYLAVYEGGFRFDLADRRGSGIDLQGSAPPGFQDLDLFPGRQIEFEPDRLQIYRVAGKFRDPAYVPARVVGEVVHRALEIWKFPANDEVDFLRWAESEFATKGFSAPQQVKAGCRRVYQMLERFYHSSLYQRMERAELLYREVPFSLAQREGSFQKGVIDALFKEDGSWFLVEFKTDRIDTEDDLLALWDEKDYQGQVEGYLSAVEQLLGSRPLPLVCFLNYQGRIHLEADRW